MLPKDCEVIKFTKASETESVVASAYEDTVCSKQTHEVGVCNKDKYYVHFLTFSCNRQYCESKIQPPFTAFLF